MNRWIVDPLSFFRGRERSSAMRVAQRTVTVLLIALLVIIPASADKAKSLYSQGADQEAQNHFDKAFDLYRQAFEIKPRDAQIRSAYERMKFRAAAEHVHKGQLLREAGKLPEALAEFEQAMRIDPSSFMAVQEARRTKDMIDQQANPDQQPKQTTMSERLRSAGSPVELAPISNQPITLRMSEDSKVVYEAIGKVAGINVLFDPDYTSRRVKIDLNGVSLGEALEIVSMQSKTFWRPVTTNTIYVAADTTAKRKEIEQQVLRTFYLSNLSSTTELQDVTNTLRTVLELQRLQQLPSQNAIVVRGTPDQVALAEKLINDLDKARPEVMVEVAVMQVSRDKLRQLGIQYPFSTTSNPTISLQNPSATSNSTTGSNTTGTGSTPSTGNLTLNDLANIDARNFQVSIPAASVAFLMNDSNTKVVQNPQIRALDGQKATLKIGERIPVATGSFQPGIGGGVGINPLVNTQFQYIDVGVNVDVTPHVFQNRDVDLKVMLEISAVDRFSNIGGIQQPVIGQRKVEHEIRLKEGEVNLLGGMLEDSETKSMSGLPWLSQIPVLRYLFGQSQTERINNEIVFVLIPRVVRGADISAQNLRTIDVGTQNQIGLRRDSRPVTTPEQGGAQRPQGAPQQQQMMQAPPQQQQQAPAATTPQQNQTSSQSTANQSQTAASSNNGPVLSFDPPTISAATNQTFSVNVTLLGGHDVFSVPAQISFDPKLMQLVNVSNAGALSQDGQSVALVHREDQQAGTVQVTATRPPGAQGVAVNGAVFTLTFQAKAPGQGTLSINRAMLRDANMSAIPAGGSQAVITVR
jgi:general secretion pathway protein D